MTARTSSGGGINCDYTLTASASGGEKGEAVFWTGVTYQFQFAAGGSQTSTQPASHLAFLFGTDRVETDKSVSANIVQGWQQRGSMTMTVRYERPDRSTGTAVYALTCT